MQDYKIKRIRNYDPDNNHSRKYFNAITRQTAKTEIKKQLVIAAEEKDIKILDIENLRQALDQKLNQIRYRFAITLFKLGIPLKPNRSKVDWDDSYDWHDYQEEYDWSHMNESELLEFLALSTNPNHIIDINAMIQSARYDWWN